MKTSGIYLITCKPADTLPRYYVGQSVDCRTRKAAHFSAMRSGKHVNSRLNAAFKKYGAESFCFEILEECSPECLDEREQWWLSEMVGCKRCYNIGTHPNAPTRGVKLSDERRRKISAATSGEKHYSFGKPMPEAYRKKISEGGKGKKRGQVTRLAISVANMGINNSMYGKSGKLSPRSRPVVGTNPDTGDVVEYESACLAEKDGFWQEAISRCCNGTQKKHLGLVWCFKT